MLQLNQIKYGTDLKNLLANAIWKEMVHESLRQDPRVNPLESFTGYDHTFSPGLLKRVLTAFAELMGIPPWKDWVEEILPIGVDRCTGPSQCPLCLGWNQKGATLKYWEQLKGGILG